MRIMKKRKENITKINVMISILEDNVPSYIFNMVKHSTLVEIDRSKSYEKKKSTHNKL